MKKNGKPPAKEEIKKKTRPVRPNRSRGFARKSVPGGKVADQLQKDGGHGVDARLPSRQERKNTNGPLVVATMNPAVTQNVSIDYRTIAMLAAAAIERSLTLGWTSNDSGSNTPTPFQPYYAWIYLTNSLVSAAQGTFPAFQAAPEWFWELSAALANKNAPFKTGTINYQWSFFNGDSDTALPPEFSLGDYFLYWGAVDPTSGNTTNGYPDLFAPPPYTVALGEAAISSMFAFYKATALTKRGMRDECYLKNDVSAFQTCYTEWGGSGVGTGGMSNTIQSECYLTSPVLAKFALYQDAYWRGYQFFAKQAGTPSYIIPRMMEVLHPREMHQKIGPIFKFYNFDWFFLQLSYILAYALEESAKDQSKQPVLPCPLTSWGVQIMLRQVLMPRFYNYMAQDLTNQGAIPNNTISFVPFTTSPNGVSLSTEAAPGVKLPFVFAEAIRAARRLSVRLRRGLVQDFVPVLGRPNNLNRLDNFTYKGIGGNTTQLYAVLPGEVDISLVDLSWLDQGNRRYISANGATLTDTIRTWNEWITSLGNNLSSLVTVGTEPGIIALSTVVNTYHMRLGAPSQLAVPGITPQPAATKALVKKHSALNVAKGAKVDFKKVGAPEPEPGSSSFYSTIAVSKLTGTQVFQEPLMRYLKAFPSPSTIGINYEADNSIEFQQVNQIEPFSIAFNDVEGSVVPLGNYTSMQTIAATAALLDIKTNLAAKSEAQIELESLAQEGSGGFFTSLASTIGESLGIPGVSQIARMVGDITGL